MNDSRDLKRIQEFVDKLKATNSTNDKIDIIKEYKDDYLINQVLKYTYSPFKQFHLTSTTVKKNKKLESKGVKPFGKVGDSFDPELHEALTTTNDSKINDDIIVEIYESGYKYKDLIIRHAKVVVNKK